VINHLVFVGNIRPGVSPFVEKTSVDLIEQICHDLKIKGLMLYTDGSFLFVLEGKKDAARLIQYTFESHEDISTVMRLVETPAETTAFKDLKFAYCNSDAREDISGTISLNTTAVEDLLPESLSPHIQLLVKNFSIVNKVAA